MIRPGFAAIVSGWTLVDDMDAITEKIEEVEDWMKINSPLSPEEEATVKMMIEYQINIGIRRGDFAPYL